MGGRDKLFDLLGREIRAIDLLRHDGRAKDARLDVLRGLLAGAITNKQNAAALAQKQGVLIRKAFALLSRKAVRQVSANNACLDHPELNVRIELVKFQIEASQGGHPRKWCSPIYKANIKQNCPKKTVLFD